MMRTVAAASLLLLSAGAIAQNCAAPTAVTTAPFTSEPGLTTCGAAAEFGQACGGGLTINQPSHVYRLAVGEENTFTVTVTPGNASYDAAAFIAQGTCTPGAPCAASADEAGPGGAESLDPTDNIPAGDYFLVVTSTNGVDLGANCGPYSVAVAPTLPVELQSFSVD